MVNEWLDNQLEWYRCACWLRKRGRKIAGVTVHECSTIILLRPPFMIFHDILILCMVNSLERIIRNWVITPAQSWKLCKPPKGAITWEEIPNQPSWTFAMSSNMPKDLQKPHRTLQFCRWWYENSNRQLLRSDEIRIWLTFHLKLQWWFWWRHTGPAITQWFY